MGDEETESLWDHITGECFEGPMAGERLAFWPVQISNVAAELNLAHNTQLLRSPNHSLSFQVTTKGSKLLSHRNKGTVLMPQFRRSMNGEIDPRLPKGEQGLDLITDDNASRFRPMRQRSRRCS